MEHKLLTIYLRDDQDDATDVAVHLDEYLSTGWTVRSLTTLSGSGGGDTSVVSGWVIVVLERDRA